MLKKLLTYAAVTGAATAAVTGMTATPAAASDAVGGDYSQNVNVLPHLCVDADRVNILAIPIELLTSENGLACDEISTGGVKYNEDKGPLSDLLDAGAGNH